MRKIIFLLLVTFMILSITACDDATGDEPATSIETIEPSETPEQNEEGVSPPPAAQEETPAVASEGNAGEIFSEPTFEYSVTWHGREISVGMRFFEVLDLGFEYARSGSEVSGFGVDAETAQEIASRMAEPATIISHYLIFGNDVLSVVLVNLSEEPRPIMESHIIALRTGNLGFPMGDIYYDGLLLSQDTSLEDVQHRFGEGDVTHTGYSIDPIHLTYDDEGGSGFHRRFVGFSFDANAYNLVFFTIQNGVNPVLSGAVWDGELRLPRYDN